jgi:uncharacterized RDD family membrane protein YckC
MTQPSFGTVAPTSRRAVAYIIDAAIAAGIGIVLAILLVVFAVMAGPEGMLGVIAIGGPVIWLLLVGWLVVYTFMQAGNGSIGMRAQGLRLVRDADGAPLGFGKALLRNIIFGLSASIVVGYFTPLFDGSGRFQGWHDKVAGSLMVDARAGAGTVTAPPTQAMPVPPRPSLPNNAGPSGPSGAPPIPGLATPTGTPNFAAPTSPAQPGPPAAPLAPGLDETVRADDVRRPAAPAPQMPAPLIPAPQIPAPASHPAAPSAGDDSLIAFVPGVTQDTPPQRRTPAPPAAPEPPTAPAAPVSDVSDIEDTRISIPGHRLVFTWDDGTRVTVSRRTLFGRNPAPEDGAVVVPVRDETLSLSKTHFEAAAEAAGGWVKDRHSTNGTIIVRDGQRITCAPGEQVRIRLGDAIEIGDRIVTIGGYA